MLFSKGPDNSENFGKRYVDYSGQVWEMVAQNDLNIAYYVKIVRGKPQKTRYAFGRNLPGRHIA